MSTITRPKSVLITGATGFVGHAIFLALKADGWDVTCASRDTLKKSSSGFVYLDLDDPATILNLSGNHRFDAIVHAGAHVGWSCELESEMFCPNVLSTGCLAYLAELWGAHMVFTSAAIIHGSKTEYIDSQTKIHLDTHYAKSKWMGEQLIISSEISHCILRVAGVFGLYGPDHLGINRAISSVVKGNPPLQISSGSALRNYIYVKDVAQVICYILRNRVEGVHLLAGHQSLKVSEMIKNLCDILSPGLEPKIKLGEESHNQIISSSSCLPSTRKFIDAILDIRKDLSI